MQGLRETRDNLLLVAQVFAVVAILAVWADINEIKRLDAVTPAAQSSPVDYEKINQIVTARIEAMPQAKDGRDGIDGSNGKDAQVNESLLRSIIQEEVAKIPRPKDGTNAETIRETVVQSPEFRTNPDNGNFEWRIVGDDSWQIIKRACEFLGVCNGQAN